MSAEWSASGPTTTLFLRPRCYRGSGWQQVPNHYPPLPFDVRRSAPSRPPPSQGHTRRCCTASTPVRRWGEGLRRARDRHCHSGELSAGSKMRPGPSGEAGAGMAAARGCALGRPCGGERPRAIKSGLKETNLSLGVELTGRVEVCRTKGGHGVCGQKACRIHSFVIVGQNRPQIRFFFGNLFFSPFFSNSVSTPFRCQFLSKWVPNPFVVCVGLFFLVKMGPKSFLGQTGSPFCFLVISGQNGPLIQREFAWVGGGGGGGKCIGVTLLMHHGMCHMKGPAPTTVHIGTTISMFCHIYDCIKCRQPNDGGGRGISHRICQVHTVVCVCIAYMSHAWRLWIPLQWHRFAPWLAPLDVVCCGV